MDPSSISKLFNNIIFANSEYYSIESILLLDHLREYIELDYAIPLEPTEYLNIGNIMEGNDKEMYILSLIDNKKQWKMIVRK